MKDNTKLVQRPLPQLPTSTCEPCETPADARSHVSTTQPPRAKHVDETLARVQNMIARVRAQCFARLAFPWRFEEYPLADLADQPRDAALDHVVWEIDHRYHATVLGEEDV